MPIHTESIRVESLTGKTYTREEEEKLRLAGKFITDSNFVLEDVFDKNKVVSDTIKYLF